MRKIILVSFTCFLFFQQISAQSVTLKGTIKDTSEKKLLSNAVVSLLQKKDSTLVSFSRSDKEGNFKIEGLVPGKYVMLISYPKFADLADDIELKNTDLDLGNVPLTQKSLLLKEVIIRTGQAIRIKGDTTEFTADSFVVKEGATVEDLLKKLPGFQVNSKGEITAQGKRVEKVLVDGEEFFGDDPTMATQNLSAKIVDKVQLFDTKTEQQNLTGIQSGNQGK
nr:carboxypeptidase regulatory-like domain-containing protein [Chitinophagaceae bacterium]